MTRRRTALLLICALLATTTAFSQDRGDNATSVATGMIFSRYHADFYEPGQPLDITIAIEGPATEALRAIGLEEDLPEGWLLISVQGNSDEAPPISPASGAAPPFDFAWIMPPTPPYTFTYTVMVPESAWGQQEIYGVLEYRLDGGALQAPPVVTLLNGPDPQPPTLTLLGNNPMEVDKNTPWSEPGYTALDYDKQDISGYVLVTGSVNTSEEGSYTLEYRVTSRRSELSASAARTVTVVTDRASETPTVPQVPRGSRTTTKNGYDPNTARTADGRQLPQPPAMSDRTETADSIPALPDLSPFRPVAHKRPEAEQNPQATETKDTTFPGQEAAQVETDSPETRGKESVKRDETPDEKEQRLAAGKGNNSRSTDLLRTTKRHHNPIAYWLIGTTLTVATALCGYLVWRLAYKPAARERRNSRS